MFFDLWRFTFMLFFCLEMELTKKKMCKMITTIQLIDTLITTLNYHLCVWWGYVYEFLKFFNIFLLNYYYVFSIICLKNVSWFNEILFVIFQPGFHPVSSITTTLRRRRSAVSLISEVIFDPQFRRDTVTFYSKVWS